MEEEGGENNYSIKVLYVPLGGNLPVKFFHRDTPFTPIYLEKGVPENCPLRKGERNGEIYCDNGLNCAKDISDCPIYKRPLKESPRP